MTRLLPVLISKSDIIFCQCRNKHNLLLTFFIFLFTSYYSFSQIQSNKEAKKIYSSLKKCSDLKTQREKVTELCTYYINQSQSNNSNKWWADNYEEKYLQVKNEFIVPLAVSGDRHCLYYLKRYWRHWRSGGGYDNKEDSLHIVLNELITNNPDKYGSLELDLAIHEYNLFRYWGIQSRRNNNYEYTRKNLASKHLEKSYNRLQKYINSLIMLNNSQFSQLERTIFDIESYQNKLKAGLKNDSTETKEIISPLKFDQYTLRIIPSGSTNLTFNIYLVNEIDSVKVSSYVRDRTENNNQTQNQYNYDLLDFIQFIYNEKDSQLDDQVDFTGESLIDNIELLKNGIYIDFAFNYFPTSIDPTEDFNVLNIPFNPISNAHQLSNEIWDKKIYRKRTRFFEAALNFFIDYYNRYDWDFEKVCVMRSKLLRCAILYGVPHSISLMTHYYYYIQGMLEGDYSNNLQNSLGIDELSVQDSVLFYLNQDTSSLGTFLKGLFQYNGQYYSQNQKLGLNKMKNAFDQNNALAVYYMKTFVSPIEKYFEIDYPWDFSMPCERNQLNLRLSKSWIDKRYTCKNFVRPEKLYLEPYNFRKIFYNNTYGLQIIPYKINISKTYGDKLEWSELYCSESCKRKIKMYKNSDSDKLNADIEKSNNKIIKCKACSNKLKKKDMIAVNYCYCVTKDGTNINIDQSTSLFGSGPLVCSIACQEKYCISRCKANGYSPK